MTRLLPSILLCAFAAACAQSVPESNPDFTPSRVDIGRGVGFGDYESYEAARLAQDRQTASAPAAAVPTNPVISSEELQAAGLPAGGQGLPPSGTIDTAALPESGPAAAASAPAPSSSPGISDEQSFAAVSARETIESDAERLARNRAQYQVVQPRAVPQREGQSGPNIVQYALNTTNVVGQPVYRRGGFFQERRFRSACAGFASPDLAQEAFLAEGGPERDRLGVDPDGDGFACSWDPAPFRAAQG
ncbi:hypothetical protein [Palleronia abyssalis]|uniref:Excalibur calcium-binding domain-containing protein n=1 Tax=Palleronia abyssalis TaxID=1501240 RepID=A0A2R8BWI2_9RHOB|nr:hypothetical protein [Palleronia abyssalis]SPJ24493.1 hypothetical protein PAA8504_02326 [Palleronia abyssalis]